MKILINASTVKYSGGLAVTLSVIHAFGNYPGIKVFIVAPPLKSYKKYAPDNAEISFVPSLILTKSFRWFLDLFWLPLQIKKWNPDLVLSMTNLPAITKYRQIFYHDNPFFTTDSLKDLNLSIPGKISHLLRNRATKRRLKNVSGIITQTSREAEKIKSIRPGTEIKIIPPSIPVYLKDIPSVGSVFPELSKNKKNILCFSHCYSHKNIEILTDVAQYLESNNAPYKIILSCIESGSHIKKMIHQRNKEFIEILGNRTVETTYELLPKVDAFILPSLLESFSLNCIEAWHFEKPLFISDREFARNICGEGAIYFDPLSAEDIYLKIKYAFENNIITDTVKQGKKQILQLPGWNAVVEYIVKQLKT